MLKRATPFKWNLILTATAKAKLLRFPVRKRIIKKRENTLNYVKCVTLKKLNEYKDIG